MHEHESRVDEIERGRWERLLDDVVLLDLEDVRRLGQEPRVDVGREHRESPRAILRKRAGATSVTKSAIPMLSGTAMISAMNPTVSVPTARPSASSTGRVRGSSSGRTSSR